MQAPGRGWKGRYRGLPHATRKSPGWYRHSPRTGPKLKSRKRFRLPHSGRNDGLFRHSAGAWQVTVEPRVGTGFIRLMALRSKAIGAGEGCARGATRLAAFLLVALVLGACSMFDKDAPIAPEEPADKLYNEGLYLLNTKKDPKNAAKKFEEVDRQHPYSEWARKALVMSAYAYYEVQVQTDSAALGEVVTGEQVRELPLNGRSFVQLTQLQPGVSAADNFSA